jgi:hypothetical protein
MTVAAVDSGDVVAGFSSAGPTPVSLQMKPDVSAPGVSVLSSLPSDQGTFGLLSGTSMASPHVAGAAALLKQRHPAWTVPQIKSALAQSGDPARTVAGSEALSTREGGGVVDLPRADVPLIFASPSGLSFGRLRPSAGSSRTVALADAGGGAGAWTVTTVVQGGPGTLTVPATVTVPGALTVTARAAGEAGDVTGFVVLTHGPDVRRIPFWFTVSAPQLGGEAHTALTRAGTYRGTTKGGPSRISRYRYPTEGDVSYPGPERAYRVRISGGRANFGVAVLSGHVVPHVVLAGAEDHLAGYPGLPFDLNPYRKSYGARIPVAGSVLPAAGLYDVVFDTRSAGAAGPFSFRFWVGDATPPKLKVASTRGAIRVVATDAGSGVDPASIVATLDGKPAVAKWLRGTINVAAGRGTHSLTLKVADYQETKNMEDVPRILPNTATLRATVRVA